MKMLRACTMLVLMLLLAVVSAFVADTGPPGAASEIPNIETIFTIGDNLGPAAIAAAIGGWDASAPTATGGQELQAEQELGHGIDALLTSPNREGAGDLYLTVYSNAKISHAGASVNRRSVSEVTQQFLCTKDEQVRKV